MSVARVLTSAYIYGQPRIKMYTSQRGSEEVGALDLQIWEMHSSQEKIYLSTQEIKTVYTTIWCRSHFDGSFFWQIYSKLWCDTNWNWNFSFFSIEFFQRILIDDCVTMKIIGALWLSLKKTVQMTRQIFQKWLPLILFSWRDGGLSL
jgi:hypothetical protein